LLALGGRAVALPELDPSIMYKVDRFSSSFWAAVNATDGERALSPLERRRAKLWLERSQSALSSADESQRFAPHAAKPDAATEVHAFSNGQDVNWPAN